MSDIVIVEDKLKRGISLAEQFEELDKKHPEWNLKVRAVCYFHTNEEMARREIENYGKHSFEMRPVSLWNFDEVMDEYLDMEEGHTIAIIDFFLDGDGSRGIPMHRVNIRYARRMDESKKSRMWFYTGTGLDNQKILCELVGKEHVLEVDEVSDDYLRLNLENDKLQMAIQENSVVGV